MQVLLWLQYGQIQVTAKHIQSYKQFFSHNIVNYRLQLNKYKHESTSIVTIQSNKGYN